MTLTITLPWPPSVNHYWRRVGNRTLISREGRRFRDDVTATVLEASPRITKQLGPLAVEVALHVPDRRRRDVDNLTKALLDAGTAAGLWHDDSQICDLRIYRAGYEPPMGRVVLTIREAPHA